MPKKSKWPPLAVTIEGRNVGLRLYAEVGSSAITRTHKMTPARAREYARRLLIAADAAATPTPGTGEEREP